MTIRNAWIQIDMLCCCICLKQICWNALKIGRKIINYLVLFCSVSSSFILCIRFALLRIRHEKQSLTPSRICLSCGSTSFQAIFLKVTIRFPIIGRCDVMGLILLPHWERIHIALNASVVSLSIGWPELKSLLDFFWTDKSSSTSSVFSSSELYFSAAFLLIVSRGVILPFVLFMELLWPGFRPV